MKDNNYFIGVIGLGYVGLPLAIALGKKYKTLGFDIKRDRIKELKEFKDKTNEISSEDFSLSVHLKFSFDTFDLSECNIYIVTVPTPVDLYNRPDLTPLRKSSEMIGKLLKKGDIVVYESTVYPGCTNEFCAPILEENSGLKYNIDFFCGYSPERINPGDKLHRLENITKIVSGSNYESTHIIKDVYQSILDVDLHIASSIEIAEAAKVIENVQRDVNIAFVNELSILFSKIGIDTQEVLEAAGTKWNFLKFKPGLVGGHCIGVDPYYLTHKATALGYHPEIILAGRRINDSMSSFVVAKLIKEMIRKSILIESSRVLILGGAFKENCNDIRNSKIFDVLRELNEYKIDVELWDPLINEIEVLTEYQVTLSQHPEEKVYDSIILAVPHDIFIKKGLNWINSLKKNEKSIFFDLKSIFPKNQSDLRL